MKKKNLTLREWREKEGLSERVAAARLKVTQKRIQLLEAGKHSVTMRTADRICRLTNGEVTRLSWPEEIDDVTLDVSKD